MFMIKKAIKLCSISAVLTLGATNVHADIYNDALAQETRSNKDVSVDKKRKPDEVLRFFDIKPGSKVLDVFAGGGYYSEILSHVVGKKGSVTAYNNAPWFNFVKKDLTSRLKGNRLPNVASLVATPESLMESNKKYDSAIFILGMHDLYYADPDNGWVAIDKRAFLEGIYNNLKSGSVFGVIDANANTGADNAVVGQKLHRVDPKQMIKDIQDVGFVLAEQSYILRNKNDDKTTSVFKPENRYNTDRSILKFVKP